MLMSGTMTDNESNIIQAVVEGAAPGLVDKI